MDRLARRVSVPAFLLTAIVVGVFVAARVGAAKDSGGGVHGTVRVLIGHDGPKSRAVALPDAVVFVEGGGRTSARVLTDSAGRFAIPLQPPGSYRLHVEARGFEPWVDGKTVRVTTGTAYPAPVQLEAPGNGGGHARLSTVWGRVHLADDANPRFVDPWFGVASEAHVVVEDGAGKAVAEAVRVNHMGEFVVAGVPRGEYMARATFEKISASAAVDTHRGTDSVDLTLPNSRPGFRTLWAQQQGAGVRNAAPGSIVEAVAEAEDDDGDAVRFAWATAFGKFLGAKDSVAIDASTGRRYHVSVAQWQLPKARATNIIDVLITDGRGGYNEAHLEVSSEDGARFSGNVVDGDGAALGGAEVRIDGLTTETDRGGSFSLMVPGEGRHVVTISRRGYKPRAKIFYGGTAGQTWRLDALAVHFADPARAIDIREASGAEVHIPAGALVDAKGQAVKGPIAVEVAAWDIDDLDDPLPGDWNGVDQGGAPLALEMLGGVRVTAFDEQAQLALAKGAAATVRVPVGKGRHHLPGTTPLFGYDVGAGVWREQAVATRAGHGYVASLARLGIVSPIVDPAVACVRVSVNTSRFTLPVTVRVSYVGGTGTVAYNVVFSQALNLLTNLPANKVITLEPLDSQGNPIPGAARTVNSGAVMANPTPAYPYAACLHLANITLNIPCDGGFLDHAGLDDPTTSAAYYAAVDPLSAKTTLASWKTANGFGADTAAAAYGNDADLGFGRGMHMKQSGGDVAFYVTNFPALPGGINDAIAGTSAGATVAMEYTTDPANTGGRYVKFYVFDPAGNRISSVDLDGRGQKFVPALCIDCHGGNNSPDARGDVGSRFLPFALDSLTYSTTPGYTRAAEEPAFKIMNQAIATTNTSTATADIIQAWYAPSMTAATQNGSALPPNWAAGDGNVYLNVVAPACRTCHVVRDGALAWDDNTNFIAFGSSIQYDVCTSKIMPNAKRTFEKFWLGTTPSRPALLKSYLRGNGAWDDSIACPNVAHCPITPIGCCIAVSR